MRDSSYWKNSLRVTGFFLAALFLIPSLARAADPLTLVGPKLYEGAEEGDTIEIDLERGNFNKTLPFDVTFKVSGKMPARFGTGTRVDARYVEFKRPPDCASFFNQYSLARGRLPDLNATDTIPVRRRARSVAIETSGFRQATVFGAGGLNILAGLRPLSGTRPSDPALAAAAAQGARFLVDFPALRPNHYYCFQFISRRSLSKEDLETLHKEFEKAVDEELRKDKYQEQRGDFTTFQVGVEDYERLRVTLSAVIEDKLANENQVVLAPQNSFFNVGAELGEITARYREEFEQIAVRTVGARLIAIKAFNESVTNAVRALRTVAERDYTIEVPGPDEGQTAAEADAGAGEEADEASGEDDTTETTKETIKGSVLVQRSADPEIRELGSELVKLSPALLKERLSGVPVDSPMAPDLKDTWVVGLAEGPTEDASTLSIQDRIDNIRALSLFLDKLSAAAEKRKLNIGGQQVNVTPLDKKAVKDAQAAQKVMEEDLTAAEQAQADDEDPPEDWTSWDEFIESQKGLIKTQKALVKKRRAQVKAGLDIVPRANLIYQATEHLADAVADLRELQQLLEERSEHIGDWVRQVLVEEQASLVVGATTVADYDTRAVWYMSADVGSGISDTEDFFTYVGWNIYLRPVNKKAHLSWTARPFTIREELMRRFSFTLGVVQSGFDEVENEIKGVIGKRAAVLGAGFRINDSLRFSVGGLVFESLNPDPLIDTSRLTWSPYAAISLDWDIGSSLAGVLPGRNKK